MKVGPPIVQPVYGTRMIELGAQRQVAQAQGAEYMRYFSPWSIRSAVKWLCRTYPQSSNFARLLHQNEARSGMRFPTRNYSTWTYLLLSPELSKATCMPYNLDLRRFQPRTAELYTSSYSPPDAVRVDNDLERTGVSWVCWLGMPSSLHLRTLRR